MFDIPLLTIVTFLPLVGALMILPITMGDEDGEFELDKRNVRNVALFTTIVTFLISLLIWVEFDNSVAGFQMEENVEWIGPFMSYHLGVDGISMLFVILTTFLMPFAILASWTSITKNIKQYMIAFLILETFMIGVFVALDIMVFYVFFEAGLIPMFIIIGVGVASAGYMQVSNSFFIRCLVLF